MGKLCFKVSRLELGGIREWAPGRAIESGRTLECSRTTLGAIAGDSRMPGDCPRGTRRRLANARGLPSGHSPATRESPRRGGRGTRRDSRIAPATTRVVRRRLASCRRVGKGDSAATRESPRRRRWARRAHSRVAEQRAAGRSRGSANARRGTRASAKPSWSSDAERGSNADELASRPAVGSGDSPTIRESCLCAKPALRGDSRITSVSAAGTARRFANRLRVRSRL